MGCLVLLSAHNLLIFVIGHVVEGLFVPFNVDLEAVEGIARLCADVFLVKLNSLLLEEVLNSRFSNCAVVGDAIVLNPSLHVLNIVVSAKDLILWQLSHSADQILITSIEGNDTAWENVVIFDVVIETWLLTFRQLFFIILDWLTIFIVLDHLLHESVLGALVFTRETIQNVTTVATIVLIQLQRENVP